MTTYSIELRDRGVAMTYMGNEYEVWFTCLEMDCWRVSKRVPLDRALELVQVVDDMLRRKNEGIMLPDEFHIVGRLEPKNTAQVQPAISVDKCAS